MEKFFHLIISFSFLLVIWGCSTTQKTEEKSAENVRYSMVYIIHGDANYTYHLNGERRKADLDVLNRAIETARQAVEGEVFIFHQKPENKLLFLIPKKDRVFYHFRNGELIAGELYSPRNGGFEAEAELYKSNRAQTAGRSFFLYFGHEIPAGSPHLVYHNSQPHHNLNTEIFSNDLRLFDQYFDMIVLSTCNNGNPLMVNALTDQADYLVASPQNLHLSHLTDEPLRRFETNPGISTEELALDLAEDSFDRLSAFLQTAVTVAVYDLRQNSHYIRNLAEQYRTYINNFRQTSLFVDNVDCRMLPEFTSSIPQDGVTLFYKPASFGTSDSRHSGWGCKK